MKRDKRGRRNIFTRQRIIDKHPYRVVGTAAGPMCTNCERGVGCWLAPDESPCSCKKKINRLQIRGELKYTDIYNALLSDSLDWLRLKTRDEYRKAAQILHVELCKAFKKQGEEKS